MRFTFYIHDPAPAIALYDSHCHKDNAGSIPIFKSQDISIIINVGPPSVTCPSIHLSDWSRRKQDHGECALTE